MGLALHEMYEVSGLVIGVAPYEEYVLSTEELHLLKRAIFWYMRLIEKCYATSTSVDKGRDGESGELNRCHR